MNFSALGAGGPRFESWYPDKKKVDFYSQPFFVHENMHYYYFSILSKQFSRCSIWFASHIKCSEKQLCILSRSSLFNSNFFHLQSARNSRHYPTGTNKT